jgi:hypothetical protein
MQNPWYRWMFRFHLSILAVLKLLFAAWQQKVMDMGFMKPMTEVFLLQLWQLALKVQSTLIEQYHSLEYFV